MLSTTASEMSTSDDDAPRQRIVFTTKLASIAPALPKQAFAVPQHLGRLGLSEVANQLLSLESPIPFDFLICLNDISLEGTGGHKHLLQDSLGSTVRRLEAQHLLSTEDVVQIEIVAALQPPRRSTSQRRPDWIGCLSGTSSLVAAGAYDGTLALFRADAPTAKTAAGLSAPRPAWTNRVHVRALRAVHVVESASSASSGSTRLATGCKAGLVKLWEATDSGAGSGASAASAPMTDDDGADDSASRGGGLSVLHAATLEGGLASIGCIAAVEAAGAEAEAGAGGDGPSCVVAAGEWEGGLSLWDVPAAPTFGRAIEDEDDEEDDDEGGAKPSKARGPRSAAPVLQPTARFGKMHRGCVSGATFGAGASSGLGVPGAVLATCSWDRSLCLWDTERLLGAGASGDAASRSRAVPPEALRQRVAVGKTPTGLSPGPSGQQLATSHSDGTARVWDTRAGGARDRAGAGSDKAGASVVLRHKGLPWVSSVAWHPSDRHLLLSAAHDGACRAWDLRAPRAPLYALRHGWPGEETSGAGAGAGEAAASAGSGAGSGSGAGKATGSRAPPKLLACAWSGADAGVSGGEDRRVVAWGMRGRGLGMSM